jgi:hypothetical protein
MDPITRGSYVPSLCLSTSVYRPSWALPAGQLLGLAVEQLLVQVEQPGGLPHPAGPFLLGDVPHLEREAHVLRDGLLRVQGVVLEHRCQRHQRDLLAAAR